MLQFKLQQLHPRLHWHRRVGLGTTVALGNGCLHHGCHPTNTNGRPSQTCLELHTDGVGRRGEGRGGINFKSVRGPALQQGLYGSQGLASLKDSEQQCVCERVSARMLTLPSVKRDWGHKPHL